MTRHRSEFPPRVRLAAWERCGGYCEGCGNRIAAGNGPHYDHAIPDAIGGKPTLENCRVLCYRPCHKLKTVKVDVPEIAKTKRIIAARANAKRKSRPMPGSKASGLRKRMDGTVERRP
jgi:5-methylcytosine-specific restriction enzyme A